MSEPRYPVGKFSYDTPPSEAQRDELIQEIENAPTALRSAIQGLSAEQIETPYRNGGWTVRQVVHHIADSHMNSYMRIKLALTEEEPTIRTYMEDRWAELPEARTAPIELSLGLLENLHQRWMLMLRAIPDADWKRTFRHPELGLMTLERNLALYAWHGRHHVAHVTELRKAKGW